MEARRLVMVMGLIATAILVFQSLVLPSGNVLSSLLPAFRFHVPVKRNFDNGKDPEGNFALDRDRVPNQILPEKAVDPGTDSAPEKVGSSGDSLTLERAKELAREVSPENNGKPGGNFSSNTVRNSGGVLGLEKVRGPDNGFAFAPAPSSVRISDLNGAVVGKSNMSSIVHEVSVVLNTSSTGKQGAKTLTKSEETGPVQSVSASPSDNSTVATMPVLLKQGEPPIVIPEMNHFLLWNGTSLSPMKPLWPSASDQELLSTKLQTENAPAVKNDRDLYAPVFWNVSQFKRSYELMENKLKVYVYKEGEKPIFHDPFLTGIYASEGWFMKLMEGNKQFVVKDPQKAHLFYLPYSSHVLRTVMITPKSSDRHKLVEFLEIYIDKIAAKYPFWNRTNGADHFLVACHDSAPYQTRTHLRHALRAMCNADVSKDFILGKDVSLPATRVRAWQIQNPLKDLGGKPASERPTLAFFAGNMHGKIRRIFLQYWENKDPNMKIFGPMPPGTDGKIAYINYMKTSKYCICPRGYSVYSPRVVEAIYYECVPVIISDNYVPPFFEVLNWETFSVFVAEKDIPSLKDILLSIPEERYLTLHLTVKKVQQHFLWHSKPVKYDIFHMILHSIWFNRLHQLRTS